jgi:large subunit ribosomal protein L28
MSRKCEICGKGPASGRTISWRGLAKKKGGIGKKVSGLDSRRFKPNIQKVKANVNGTVRRMKVCTRCIRSGKVAKAG